VMEEAAEAIAAIDLSGRVIYANARWRDLLGVEGEEIIGNILEQLVPTDDQPGVHNVLEQAAHGKRVSGHRFRLRHRNGALLTLRMSVGAIRDDRGLIVGTLGIVRDITEEYEAQRLKDELLTTTSHELRTPVTTIRGMTQLLLRSLEQGEIPGPEMLARRLQIIQRETDRLARLSSDLTDAAKLQTGALALHRERYDLRTIVEELIVIQRELPGVDGRWTLNLQLPEHALSVRVDRTRIE